MNGGKTLLAATASFARLSTMTGRGEFDSLFVFTVILPGGPPWIPSYEFDYLKALREARKPHERSYDC